MLDLSTLNAAQREAVVASDGPVLVIAGAGSGKTRTLVHRLAWLAEQGVDPSQMLLLTFTRKASQEMLVRAQDLLGFSLGSVQGGTFHGFAYTVLRQFRPAWAQGPVTVMDSTDSTGIIQQCRADLKIAKGSRSFPKSQTVIGLLSKVRNKETTLGDVLQRDSPHLMMYEDELQTLGAAYEAFRRKHGLLDYDDLLFELETILKGDGERPGLSGMFRERFRYILVDEYQDTNKVQARLVQLLSGHDGNVMAVGDDAQSIYAFRGADVRNILDFPRMFPAAKIIRLEENYRSTRYVLDVANAVLSGAKEGYSKQLFTRKTGGIPVRMLRPMSDLSQAQIVAKRIEKLLATYDPKEIAVLFRAGFHSYHVEVELTRAGIAFRKYGGLKYTEAAHIKDVLAFVRLVVNPLDMPSFQRVASLCPGIGPKTAQKIYLAAATGDQPNLQKSCAKFPALLNDLALLDALRKEKKIPQNVLQQIIEWYQPRLETEYPDDWPRRMQGLEELKHIAAGYTELDAFIADLSLETPDEERAENASVTLSTIHSAKGLEWDAVIVLDLVEERFPSRRAALNPEDFEEERRLMYVACTRARENLELSVPRTLYDKQSYGSVPAMPSPFLADMPFACCEEWQESYDGNLVRCEATSRAYTPQNTPLSNAAVFRSRWQQPNTGFGTHADLAGAPDPDDSVAMIPAPASPVSAGSKDAPCCVCTHKIFGRGKVVERLEGGKCRVNFPGLGLKVIMSDFLTFEE